MLFDRLDADPVDGDVEKLPAKDVKEVVDLCYQCKLCYNHCPYTPPHRWQVDFPRLMLRSRSAEARAKGVTLQDRFLGNTELVGRLGSMTAPVSNWVSSLPPQRALMQAVLGIHKDRQLPAFHRETFSAWFDRRRRDIVVPGPTCSYMLKQEYPWLDGSEDADLVASHTRDLFEYLAGLHAAGRLDTRFPNAPAKVAYQLPCHLKAQNMGTKVRRSAAVDRRRRRDHREVLGRGRHVGHEEGILRVVHEAGRAALQGCAGDGATRVATDCPLAALQIRQGTGLEARHPIRILAEAYGLEEEPSP